MQRIIYYRFIVVLLFLFSLFTGCAYIASKGPTFHDRTENNYFEDLIHRSRQQLKDNFSYQIIERNDKNKLPIIGAAPPFREEAMNAPLLLRFAWFSDVQLRQRELKLYSGNVSRALDDAIASFQYNPAQEDFLWAVYLSQIEATNRYHSKEAIDFMIHTGDSIDAGTLEELYQFVYISNQLKIPWLNLIGNHDFSVFGNYVVRLGVGHDPGFSFFPVGGRANFIWMHRKERLLSGYGRLLVLVPSEKGHPPSEENSAEKKLPSTYHHGFDWYSGATCDSIPKAIQKYDDKNIAGNYFADLCKTPIPIRIIGLNSMNEDRFGGFGAIKYDKLSWLKGALLPAGKKGINLLFMHDRPQTFDFELKSLLSSFDYSPLVVFTGHTHEAHVKQHTKTEGRNFYELNTGSVLEFPQTGRIIELNGTPGGPVWLVSRALWNSDMTVQEKDMPSAEKLDAFLKICEKEDLREFIRETFTDAIRCGNLGSYHDYRRDIGKWWRIIGKRQNIKDAWKNTNVIIPISSWLGLTVRDLEPEEKKRLGSGGMEGVYVTEIVKKGPADTGAAGLEAGDLIVEVENRRVSKADDLNLLNIVANEQPGKILKIEFLRGNEKRSTSIVLGGTPEVRALDKP